MEEESFGIRDAFKREPEQTSFLIRFGLGGAFVIAVYSAIAGLFLNALIAQPVTLLLTLGYGSILVLSTARLVSSAVGRRFVESALSSRTPHRVAERAGEAAQAAAPLATVREQASFNRALFMLRLQDEVATARREGREMCVVAIEATAPGMPMNADLAERIANEFARLAASHHKTITQTLSVSESEYVMSLPTTDATEAKAFVSNVVQAMGNYWCHFGTAVYPVDGTSAESLVTCARQAVEESRGGKSGSKSHAVA
jgi:GGDEF domain-containing protein